MRKLRVLHIITRMSRGGAQENTLINAARVDPTRFESTLISGPSAGPEGDILDKVRASGVEFLEIPELTREPAPLRDAAAFAKMMQLLNDRRFDIVHTHTSKAGILGRWAAYWKGVPIVVHSSHSHIFYGYFPTLTTRFFVGLERCAATVSHRLQELTELGVREHLEWKVGKARQFKVVYSGIDLEPFRDPAMRARREALRAGLGLGAEDLAILCVARLAPIKDQATLLAAMPRVRNEIPQAKLLLAGSGETEAALREQVTALGLQDAVTLLGARTDIPELLAAADIFALTSLNEGMGRVFVEAAAAGLPCVATRVGGIPEVVLDGVTGILVPPRDPVATAEAIMALATDPDRRRAMGEAAERIVERFSIREMIRTIESDYLDLAREHIADFR